MGDHDQDIGQLKANATNISNRVDSISTDLKDLDKKVDKRHDETNKRYRNIVWGIAVTIITGIFGRTLVDYIASRIGGS